MAYIDKELFKQDIKMRYCNNCARPNEIKCRACHVDDMLGEIEDAPTADVVEVKHGEWVEIKTGEKLYDYCFKCSNCNKETPPNSFVVSPDYCPHCGAKMDGGNAE